MDPVAELASKLNRPPASLAAFSRLTNSELRTLTEAIDAASEARRHEIDAQLVRALRGPWLVRLLRGRSG